MSTENVVTYFESLGKDDLEDLLVDIIESGHEGPKARKKLVKEAAEKGFDCTESEVSEVLVELLDQSENNLTEEELEEVVGSGGYNARTLEWDPDMEPLEIKPGIASKLLCSCCM